MNELDTMLESVEEAQPIDEGRIKVSISLSGKGGPKRLLTSGQKADMLLGITKYLKAESSLELSEIEEIRKWAAKLSPKDIKGGVFNEFGPVYIVVGGSDHGGRASSEGVDGSMNAVKSRDGKRAMSELQSTIKKIAATLASEWMEEIEDQTGEKADRKEVIEGTDGVRDWLAAWVQNEAKLI